MVTSLDVRAVAGHHAMPAVLLLKRPMLHLIRGGLREGGGGGRGGNLPSSLMAFFNIHVIDIFTTY